MTIESTNHSSNPGILDGIKVLDFSAVISGPYCTRMMADLGADVIKIEPPEGELLRHAPPFNENDKGQRASTLFAPLNAGKRCISLDLKKPESIQALHELVKQCDVVVENFSPGVMTRLGLDYPSLRVHKANIVMCSISGFGQTGPMAARPAYAPIVHAWSGFDLTLLAAQSNPEKPLNMGPPVADTTASQQAFGAICAALFYRERTGRGQYIDISMYDALIATLHKDIQQAQNPLDEDRYYGPLQTADGWIIVMVLSDRHVAGLAKVTQNPRLLEDPRFASSAARFHNYNELMALTEQWTKNHSTEELDKQFSAAGVPASPYRSLSESLLDDQLRHRDMITSIANSAGEVTTVDSAMLFSETPAKIREWAADIGQHNTEVLAQELQLSAEVLSALGIS